MGTQESTGVSLEDVQDPPVRNFVRRFAHPAGYGFKTLASSGAELGEITSLYRKDTAKSGSTWRTDSVVVVWNLNEVLQGKGDTRLVPLVYLPTLRDGPTPVWELPSPIAAIAAKAVKFFRTEVLPNSDGVVLFLGGSAEDWRLPVEFDVIATKLRNILLRELNIPVFRSQFMPT